MTMTQNFHGSDVEKIEEEYGIRKEELISFSANVNPLGISPKLREGLAGCIDVITSYPDREYTQLRKAIAAYCNIDAGNIIVGNGSTELISAVIRLQKPQKACVVTPAYSEYEHEIGLAGASCVCYELKAGDSFALHTEELFRTLEEGVRLLVLCNPNNPTSTCLSRETLATILEYTHARAIFVMIDETYMEFVKDYESVTAAPLTGQFDNFIVLRGVSKFFAAPGLRLGYGITGNQRLREHINEIKNPWTVNSLADAAGKILFSDSCYIQETSRLIQKERGRVTQRLRSIEGLRVFEPSANFVLCEITKQGVNAGLLFEAALREKMLIRSCASFHGLDGRFFRLCFMLPEANDRLLACIKQAMDSQGTP